MRHVVETGGPWHGYECFPSILHYTVDLVDEFLKASNVLEHLGTYDRVKICFWKWNYLTVKGNDFWIHVVELVGVDNIDSNVSRRLSIE